MRLMKHLLFVGGVLLGLGVAVLMAWGRLSRESATPMAVSAATAALPTGVGFGGLPGRSTVTPANETPFALPTAPRTPVVTSPLAFPTPTPERSPTPARLCSTVFPIESVEAIRFGVTTLAQLEAAFGTATYQSGRPTRFRFEDEGCVLLVTIGVYEALAAELWAYGTLDLLLERYGPPAGVGVSQGNLTLLMVGNAVLLYPDAGIIAVFDAAPGDLTRATPISSLQFRPSYDLDAQFRRLNARAVDWQPPLR
jgi:hypothetical protein